MPYYERSHGVEWVALLQTFMACETRLLWHTNPEFMPYEPILLGVRVVFNVLSCVMTSSVQFPASPLTSANLWCHQRLSAAEVLDGLCLASANFPLSGDCVRSWK